MAKYDLNDRQISEGKDNLIRFCLWEKQYQKYNTKVQLTWKRIRATKENRINLSKTQGVYAFVVRPEIAGMDWSGYILYIGMTNKQNFQERFTQYLNEPKKKKPRFWVSRMFKRWKKNLYYYYADTPANKAVEVEQALLSALLPPNNERFPGILGKQKKEIYR